MEKLTSFVESFLHEAKIYSNGILEGDNKKANKADKNLTKLYKKIKEMDGIEKLKNNITQKDEGVRFCIAATIIKEFPQLTEKVLKDIVANDTLFSSLATVVLDLWEKGQL